MKNELENIYHSKINNFNFLLVDITYRKPHLHFDIEFGGLKAGCLTGFRLMMRRRGNASACRFRSIPEYHGVSSAV